MALRAWTAVLGWTIYLETKAGIESLDSCCLLVGEAANDEDDHCGHPPLIAPTQVGELDTTTTSLVMGVVQK